MVEVSIISALLRQLLRTHNRVSLPGLGAFVVDLTPASLIKGGRAMLPPSKCIAFSAAETWNDGLLEQALAKDQEYTPEGAQKQIAAFSQKLIEQLTAGRRIEFPELGIMRMTADREWRFTPFEPVDVDADSFGLLELEMTPISAEPPAPFNPVLPPPVQPFTPPKPPMPVVNPPTENRRCNTVCWVFIILLLLIVGGYMFRRPVIDYFEKSYYTPEELAYLHGQTTDTKTPVTPPPPAPVAAPEAAVEPEPELVQQKPVSHPVSNEGKTRRYEAFHILLTQFNNDEEAKEYAQRIKDQIGYSAVVIHTGDNIYKVSVLRYPSQQEAEEILAGLKSTDKSEFQNAWVEKY
ncbi:MAG: SPOR domain-containing protein [Prevotellaceae bacterium]|jgi:nucleoid DNA-binding protein/cell division septation protein DedD|nr:SPOR domain-containing protein [Prevotellaceae bacterium]